MPLEMKENCERCQCSLGTEDEVFICSYECTYCPDCAAMMSHICPNCGGELVPRPARRA